MENTLVIVSGGMDSVTLFHYLVKRKNKRAAVLTFKYGQKHSKEVEAAKYQVKQLHCSHHKIWDLSFLIPAFEKSALISANIDIPEIDTITDITQPITYVPNRNMIFFAIAAAYAETLGITEIYFGAQSHDLYGYWDTTPQFIERVNNLFSLNKNNLIQVYAPFVHLTKSDILSLGIELGVDYSNTWSCYHGNLKACGKCPTCAERLSAFREIGISDPLDYE
jgi:7-cyano-7-deazaguanine synthase